MKTYRAINEKRYNQLWKSMDILGASAWSESLIIQKIKGKNNLEIGPGNYPRLPIGQGNYFIDVSSVAVDNLKQKGAQAIYAAIEETNFKKNFFNLVIAMDVLEHIDDDRVTLKNISQVLKSSGHFIFSVPLGKLSYSQIDKAAGHRKRYETYEIEKLLKEAGLKIIKWRRPSQKYWHFEYIDKMPFYKKIVEKIYLSKNSHRFFNLPKFLVNILSKIHAFVDRITAPNWNNNIEDFRNYSGSSVCVLSQKV